MGERDIATLKRYQMKNIDHFMPLSWLATHCSAIEYLSNPQQQRNIRLLYAPQFSRMFYCCYA